MTRTSSPTVTSLDVFKLAVCLAALAWMAVDWQSYTAAVNASVGAALVWVATNAGEWIPGRLGLDTLG